MFTFEVFLNYRKVFKTETEASYTTNWNAGDVCMVAQDKQGNIWIKCHSPEPFEGAWARLGLAGD